MYPYMSYMVKIFLCKQFRLHPVRGFEIKKSPHVKKHGGNLRKHTNINE